METIIFFFIILSVYHYVMESLVLPVLKNEIRYKLVSLRDKLYMLKIKKQGNITKEIFNDLERSIGFTHNYIDQFNLIDYALTISKLKKDQKVMAEVERDMIAIENQGSAVKEILYKFTKYSKYAFVINAGSWLLYVFPFFLIYLIYQFIKSFRLPFYKDPVVIASQLGFVYEERKNIQLSGAIVRTKSFEQASASQLSKYLSC